MIGVLLDALKGNVKAEKAVLDLRPVEPNTTGGMKILLNKSDIVFKSEKVHEACNAYFKFITFQKYSEMTMTHYILEYEYYIVQWLNVICNCLIMFNHLNC